ncbi:hypothetical protein COK05_06515 [Bacillus cereus]|uniref:Uncharacterized protein n=1 Tax=Bacillus cereus TaxID=1396 RepID=A0A2C1MJT5_BACCE|nr:hypothetical protein COK05_06515 [Bacillus cereus]PGU10279.1 hypothetical protein COD21_14685 [Bacillus cereus]
MKSKSTWAKASIIGAFSSLYRKSMLNILSNIKHRMIKKDSVISLYFGVITKLSRKYLYNESGV